MLETCFACREQGIKDTMQTNPSLCKQLTVWSKKALFQWRLNLPGVSTQNADDISSCLLNKADDQSSCLLTGQKLGASAHLGDPHS